MKDKIVYERTKSKQAKLYLKLLQIYEAPKLET